MYFPPADAEWADADPGARGWNQPALDRVLQLAGQRDSTALVVVEHGRILAERYWNGTDASTARDVASVQKSVVAMLFGAAVAATRLRPSDPVSSWLGAGWSRAGTAESGITCRHLLTMTSGLDESLRPLAAPGSVWSYNTVAYAKLHQVLLAATGRSLQEFSDAALFGPTGAAAVWRARRKPAGNAEQGLVASARDLARFGLLVLAGGHWERREVVPTRWCETMLTRSQDLNHAYGTLWWLNGQDNHLLPGDTSPRAGSLIPTAPADLAVGLGAGGQKLYVVPSRGLVVVRLGDTPAGGRTSFDTDLWSAITEAAPHP
ncbi:serine hydrolase domain-containing protein [Micromonospora sp. BQ11]|uniref:serine hydrolase domain-containing protein n=1 Tax=Micromonospora sp. BQ11 TaxID=3452212 RepID=UPI003F8B65F8